MCQQATLSKPKNMRDAVAVGNADSISFAEWMVWIGMRWLTYGDLLVGMAWAFMELHETVAEVNGESALMDEASRQTLKGIASRERNGLEVCKREIETDEKRNTEFRRGVATARRAIQACFAS
jgi:hypothetical protein